MNIEAHASTFGLDLHETENGTVLTRNALSVTMPLHLDARTPQGRHLAFCAFAGARLGLDRLHVDYDFAHERPGPEKARNVYEVPSIYGERLQHLLPAAAVELAAEIAGEPLVREPWVAPGFEIVLVLETSRHFHVLADSDLDSIPWDRENMVRYARFALFYDAYGFRPTRVETRGDVRLKWFSTTNGQAASRALLFPDFDLDAAKDDGAFAILDRNRFVVAHPHTGRASALERLAEVMTVEMPATALPFSNRMWLMTDSATILGPTYDGAPDFVVGELARDVVVEG